MRGCLDRPVELLIVVTIARQEASAKLPAYG
jgi:hypothetical protein